MAETEVTDFEESPFQPGDRVRLKSGSPIMVVDRVFKLDPGTRFEVIKAECVGFLRPGDSSILRETFNTDALVPVDGDRACKAGGECGKIQPMAELANGATVLCAHNGVLLALWKDNPQPFVVWDYNDKGETFHGDYFGSSEGLQACERFSERVRKKEKRLI
jgi:uncharacterized protein YodC (DUF2158 family)